MKLPDAARDVIRRRLARLDDRARSVLNIASVIGREFDFPILERVSEFKGRFLLDALDRALALCFVSKSPSGVGQYQRAAETARQIQKPDLLALAAIGLGDWACWR